MRFQSLPVVFGIALLSSVPALAADETPRSLLGPTDARAALLSSAPLGPPAKFERPRIVAKSDAVKPRQKPAATIRKPRSNPLDSYARDVRRQTWPCTGGGICAWSQSR